MQRFSQISMYSILRKNTVENWNRLWIYKDGKTFNEHRLIGYSHPIQRNYIHGVCFNGCTANLVVHALGGSSYNFTITRFCQLCHCNRDLLYEIAEFYTFVGTSQGTMSIRGEGSFCTSTEKLPHKGFDYHKRVA